MLRKLKFRKISWKLTLIYALIFSMVLVALNAGILVAVRFYLIRQAKFQVQDSSRITMSSLSSEVKNFNLTDSELLHQAKTIPEINIKITDINGKTLISTDKYDNAIVSTTSNIGTLNVLELKHKHLVVQNSYIIHQGKKAGILQVVYDMHENYEFIKLLLVLMAIADLIGIIFSVAVGFLISKQILKPIDKITKTAKEISASDLKSRIDVGPSDDELSRLAITFNEMIERLQQSFERQNRFVSDASHELRTPIAIVQGYAGLIDRWGKNDRGVLDESIAAIRNETENMTSLIERLLFLARGDSGSVKLQKEDVDLKALIEEVVQESKLIAPDHTINCNVKESTGLYADSKLIKQMIRALIDNSIKYTPKGGHIGVEAFSLQGHITIAVKDNGIGIPYDDIPHIFDRFYRVDKARSKEKGGSGLGLSIVKWIVEIHHGTIKIQSEQNKGTAVIIQFPDK